MCTSRRLIYCFEVRSANLLNCESELLYSCLFNLALGSRLLPTAACRCLLCRRHEHHQLSAWCMQENLLSRRILHFGPTEMSWQCLEEEMCECTVEPTVASRDELRARTNSMHDGTEVAWAKLVEELTSRNLTCHHDRLPAIGGLAKLMAEGGARGRETSPFSKGPDSLCETSPLSAGDYLAGIWRRQLGSLLAWFVLAPRWEYRGKSVRPSKRPPSCQPRHKGLCEKQHEASCQSSHRLCQAPSWSLASVTGAVSFLGGNCFFEVLDASCDYAGPNSYGTVLAGSGRVVVRGPLWPTVYVNRIAQNWRVQKGWDKDFPAVFVFTRKRSVPFRRACDISGCLGFWDQVQPLLG
jgi:hypothetical protein